MAAFSSRGQIFPYGTSYGMFPDPATQQADVYKKTASSFADSPLVNQFLPDPVMSELLPNVQAGFGKLPSVQPGFGKKETPDPMAKDKSNLAYMLIALGGALRGDKNFIQNTMAIKKSQTEKERREAQKKRYQEALASAEPGSSTYNLLKGLGEEGMAQATIASFQAQEAKSSQDREILVGLQKEARAEAAEIRKEERAEIRTIGKEQREAIGKRGFELFKKELEEISPGQKIQQEEYNVLVKLKSVGGDPSQLNDYEKRIYEEYIKRPEALSIWSLLGSQERENPLDLDI